MGTLLHNLNALRHATDAHVIGIHHGTQTDGTKSRGHSTLPNGADAVVQCEWSDQVGAGTLTLGFARDDVCGAIGAFRTSVAMLGLDDDGDEITTLLIDECEADDAGTRRGPGRPRKGLNTHAKKARDALANVLATNGKKGLTGVPPSVLAVGMKEWQDEFYRTAMIDSSSPTRRSAFGG
jgi:hypothetical protein